ncbi:hypothetical protein P43SY_001501 [Pythium insidiosum]|uniref:Transmembrane protein n=1 Tax=Pythium insidiosum TaxID=114742 RepID=A0AAD5L9T9_PYTIN|nr:hypothetical protein P43SY_001501 [Pythium insidiosum]
MYDKTPGSVLEIAFVAYKVGMPMEDYKVLTRVHAFFAAIHILLGGLMVIWSLGKRRFSFGPLQELSVHSFRKAGGRGKVLADSEAPLLLFARRGFFGVEGAHFDEILAVREIVESALQAYQAYRMSQLLMRPWLMLVVNCWMAPLVHLVFHRNELLRRALSLLCDAILDFTAAMVVPAVLMFSYYDRFDPETWGFPNALWYDDVWTVKILSEFQIMLVMSWGDLASRCVFSIGLISCIENAKELIREAPSRSPQQTVASAPNTRPPTPLISESKTADSPALTGRVRLWASFRHARSQSIRRFLQALQALCGVLGLVVIVLHVYAESTPRLEQCLIQVNPWLERKPACLFLEWDCHINHDSGDSAAIAAQWTKSSPTFVQRIMILHCSAFVMPTIFVSRHELTGLKMYNTTIADWGAEAAITESNHPAMMMAYFLRVNMSHTGSLPLGLMTSPFPQTLADIELAIFQITGLEHFQLGGVSLPLTPPTPDESFLRDTTVRHLYLAGTNLTWLPRWVDTFASLQRSLWYQPALDLTATPICDAIGEMQAGRLDRFPVEWTANVAADQVSRYMNVRRSNLSALASVVACNGLPKLAYPLDEDDARYSV